MQQSITTQKLVYDAKKDEAFTLEHSLAEYLPGISRVIKVYPTFDNCRFFTENGKAFMEASGKFNVIYLSDFGGKIKCASFDETFSCAFKEPFEPKGEYTAIPVVYLGALSANPLSGRKIRFKGTINFSCGVYSSEETGLYLKDDDDNSICALTKDINICRTTIVQSGVLSTGAELNLEKESPAASEVIYPRVSIHSLKCTSDDGHMKIEGKMSMYALYECAQEDASSDSGTAYASVNSDADFNCEFEDYRIKEGQICNAYIDVNSVECSCSFDSYGENRVISFDIRYTITATLWENEQHTATEDVFSTQNILTTESKKLLCGTITSPLSRRITVRETVHGDISGLYEISGCFANLRSVSKENVSGKAFALAKCQLEIVGTNASGEMLCTDIPVTMHVPIDDCGNENMESEYVLTVCSCNTKVRDGSLETEIEFDISGVCKAEEYVHVICSATPTEESVKPRQKGEIIVCYPCKDDNVWSLAKKYATPPQAICQVNKIEEGSDSLGKVVIIP